MAEQPITSRVFTVADQAAFATLSGDRNPMHMDALAARRTQAGTPVVHGVHAVLWSLNALCGAGVPLDALASAKIRFERFVYLDREVTLQIVRRDNASLKFQVVDDGLQLLSVVLKFGARGEPGKSVPARDISPAEGSSPENPPFEDMSELSGRLTPPAGDEAFQQLFPALSKAVDPRQISSIAQLSTLVGMVCPGLHSVFSAFSIDLVTGEGAPGLTFRTTRADARFRMVTMAFNGWGIRGEVVAFARQEPVAPPSMNHLIQRVGSTEFAHASALVVGGSRGLGAAAAKLIAAGGGRVTISYARGRQEAERLQQEIAEARGPQACRVIQLDVNNLSAETLAGASPPFNQLYYFATPQIFRQKSEVFSPSVFQEFSSVYVGAFHSLVQQLLTQSDGRLDVFYPSSAAVTERPRGLTEYAMAKAAGEILCSDLRRSGGQLRTVVARIPRTATDQTSTIMPVESADPVDVLLPLVREMCER